MKKYLIALLVAMLLLVTCAPAAEQGLETSGGEVLLVTAGEGQQSFSADDLQALPAVETTFKDVAYKGVTVPALLAEAGINPDEIKALKAIAADGYTVNYDPAQVLKDNVLVAYALADGNPMTADDGNFRMVLPDEEGKLNLRMLTELQVIQ
jgi:hypothetical protein